MVTTPQSLPRACHLSGAGAQAGCVRMFVMNGRFDIDRVRARSFGGAAASYDRYRPRYPDQLIDDVVAMLPGRRVLEVGAGTGIATAAFARRGLVMTCVEPDPDMAALLSAKLAAHADVQVEVASFEDWSAARRAGVPGGDARGAAVGFDALVSAQAWHWTNAATRWADAAAALGSGGVIALFWNQDGFADPRILDAFIAAYERRGIEIRPFRPGPLPVSGPNRTVGQQRLDGWPEADADADRYFTHLRIRQYHWTRRMSVGDYLARINTTSAHLILPPQVRDDLTDELTTTLASYGDDIELTMATDLATAIRH